MKENQPLSKIETATAVIERRHDGIVSATAKAGTRGTVEDAKENMRVARSLAAGSPLKLLIVVSASASLDPDARRFHVTAAALEEVSALALVMETRFAHSIADVVLRVCARQCPMRAFSSRDRAIDWLREQVGDSSSPAGGLEPSVVTGVDSEELLQELVSLEAHRAVPGPNGESRKIDAGSLRALLDRVERLSVDHQRAEAAREFLEGVLEAMDDAVVVLDVHGGISFVNAAGCALLGYAPGDVVGHDASFLFGEELQADLAGRESLRNVDAFLSAREGHQIPVTINGARMVDDDDDLVATVLVARDVTEQKKTERELEHHRHHLQELVKERTYLLEQTNLHLRRKTDVLDAVVSLLREGLKCRDVDEIAERCLVACKEVSASDGGFVVEASADGALRLVVSSDSVSASHPTGETLREGSPLIEQVLAEGKEETFEDVSHPLGLAGRGGAQGGSVSLLVFPIKAAGSPWGALALTKREGRFEPADASDVARLVFAAEEAMDRKRAELDVERRAEELHIANRDISQYAHVVSHDLRTPLRAIRQYSDFIREDLEGRLEVEQEGYLDDLSAATDRADALVDDLLSFSRIGTRPTTLTTVDVGVLMESVIEGMGFMTNLSVIMPDDWPTVSLDVVPFRQVFQNLVGNAVKFNRSEPKRIELGWSRSGDGDFSFFVKDNGIGIDPRHHEKIFGVFERLHGPEDFEGTGIGLAIAHRAVSKMGGYISVESALGEGSTFIVHLPDGGPSFREL